MKATDTSRRTLLATAAAIPALIRSYVQKDYRDFMTSAMTAMQKQATSELQTN